MSYKSEIIAVIGGTPAQIQQFVDHISTLKIRDKDKLLPLFQIVEIAADLSVYAYYHRSIPWYKGSAISIIWNVLRRQADKAKLCYIFYRFGEDETDIDLIESTVDRGFDHRLYNLVSIVIYRYFKIDKKLASKLGF